MPVHAGISPDQGDPGIRRGDGGGSSITQGIVAGLARHACRRAPIEVIDRADITVMNGIAGDHRGARKPGGTGKRQVTLMERGDWAAALVDLLPDVARDIPWWERRCNMLVDGMDLPQVAGTRLLLGDDVVLEVTRETDPCERMDALAPGLFAALKRDWRGGVCTRVLHGGTVAIGDVIRIAGL